MVSQTLDRVDIQAAPIAVATYGFIVTLLNRKTRDERSFEISTLTDSFLPVLREIQWKRDELGLFGYDIFEVLDLNGAPF